MSDDDTRDGLPAQWPGGIIAAEEGALRVFWIASETMQCLVDRLALVLGERMGATDELHVTYNAMQSGWLDHPGRQGNIWQRATTPWTELQFDTAPSCVDEALNVSGAYPVRSIRMVS